jgi:hypothetical protein
MASWLTSPMVGFPAGVGCVRPGCSDVRGAGFWRWLLLLLCYVQPNPHPLRRVFALFRVKGRGELQKCCRRQKPAPRASVLPCALQGACCVGSPYCRGWWRFLVLSHLPGVGGRIKKSPAIYFGGVLWL